MITRSPRTSSKVLILITATLWIARVVELSRALTLRIIFPCWWTQVCRRPSASLDDSQRRLAERAGCILLPIHTHTIWLLAWLGVVSVTPLIEISRPKTRPLSPPRILPQLFRVFVFLGGGHPTTRNLLCSPLPAEISVAFVASEGGRGRRLFFFQKSESSRRSFQTDEPRPRKPERRHREPRPHKSGTRARALLDQHTSRPTAPPLTKRERRGLV